MKQLLTIVVPRISAEWVEVAHHLEFSISKIMTIQKKYRYNPNECCYHLLEEWIGTNQGVSPKNWVTLLSAIRKDENILALCDMIEKQLKE